MNDKHPYIPIESERSLFIHFRWKLLNLMAVKALKIIFENFIKQLPLFDTFVNCKSVSVLAGPLSFLLQKKLICLTVYLLTIGFSGLPWQEF